MNQRSLPPHIPHPPCDPAAYEELYTFNSGFDRMGPDYPDWREIRIPSGSSAADVYRLLPSAENFEYGGYVTKTRVRYMAFGPTNAETITAKPCTFHSHPTSHPDADKPSVLDIYSFLKWRNLRAITVGRHWIWVWTKNRQNLKAVRRLREWENKHISDTSRRLEERFPDNYMVVYMGLVLRRIGLRLPRKPVRDPARWSVLLREFLGIKTALFRR